VAGLGYIRNISAYLMFVTILLCFCLEIATERQALERYVQVLNFFFLPTLPVIFSKL
jgi:hypothetical protein